MDARAQRARRPCRPAGGRCRRPAAPVSRVAPERPARRGVWNIPYPADGAVVTPDVAVAPLVGFDRACYRLSYGGGFSDRTLASLEPRALAIGVGYPQTELKTIFRAAA